MISRKDFAEKLAQLKLKKVDQAIAFLWFYRQTQAYEERSATELSKDLDDESLGKPNVTRLNKELKNSKKAIKGKRPNTFQLHIKYVKHLNNKYGSLINLVETEVTSSVIPIEFVKGTKRHFEELVYQINGCYDRGFCDASATMIRRLLESLIIEVFVHHKITDEIKINGVFVMLDGLIRQVKTTKKIDFGRNVGKNMDKIKDLGDTAAHDRTYITQMDDIKDHKFIIRKTIKELLVLSGFE